MFNDLSFNSVTVCRLTKISQRQLNDWVNKGIIHPSIPSEKGRGKKLTFSFIDLVQIKTAAFLRHNGITPMKMKKALEYIKDNFPNISVPLAELKFLTDGNSVFILTSDDNELTLQHKQLVNASAYGQVVFIFKLGAAVQELEDAVKVFIHSDQKVVKVHGTKYLITITPDVEDGGYVSECLDLPGCFSQGETKHEAIDNIKLAIVDYLGEEESQRARA